MTKSNSNLKFNVYKTYPIHSQSSPYSSHSRGIRLNDIIMGPDIGLSELSLGTLRTISKPSFRLYIPSLPSPSDANVMGNDCQLASKNHSYHNSPCDTSKTPGAPLKANKIPQLSVQVLLAWPKGWSQVHSDTLMFYNGVWRHSLQCSRATPSSVLEFERQEKTPDRAQGNLMVPDYNQVRHAM